jgi:hypothetical protein
MIDIPTLRVDDTEELEVIVSVREGNVCVTLRVDGAEMFLPSVGSSSTRYGPSRNEKSQEQIYGP